MSSPPLPRRFDSLFSDLDECSVRQPHHCPILSLPCEQKQTLASSSKSASPRAEFALESVPLETDRAFVSKLAIENTKRDGCSTPLSFRREEQFQVRSKQHDLL